METTIIFKLGICKALVMCWYCNKAQGRWSIWCLLWLCGHVAVADLWGAPRNWHRGAAVHTGMAFLLLAFLSSYVALQSIALLIRFVSLFCPWRALWPWGSYPDAKVLVFLSAKWDSWQRMSLSLEMQQPTWISGHGFRDVGATWLPSCEQLLLCSWFRLRDACNGGRVRSGKLIFVINTSEALGCTMTYIISNWEDWLKSHLNS